MRHGTYPDDNPTRIAFLKAIRATPDDDLCRLVYADWLEENRDVKRAELIRLMCANRRWRDGRTREAKRLAALRESIWPNRWRSGGVMYLPHDGWEFRYDNAIPEDPRTVLSHAYLDRGFVDLFTGSFDQWVHHHDSVLCHSVNLTVRLTDRPAMLWGHDKAGRDHVVLQGTTITGGVAWRAPAGWDGRLDPDDAAEVREGLLKANWPDVAKWELPPDGGLMVPVGFLEELTARDPQAAAALVATGNVSTYHP